MNRAEVESIVLKNMLILAEEILATGELRFPALKYFCMKAAQDAAEEICMNQRPMFDPDHWMSIALAEEGVEEFPGDQENPRIIEYHKTTTGKFEKDEIPWCSSFVNWVFLSAGIRGTDSAAARSWAQWGRPLYVPLYGCLVVLSRTSDPRFGHVGFFLKAENGKFLILGGNQKNRVSRAWFPKHQAIAFRWPSERLAKRRMG